LTIICAPRANASKIRDIDGTRLKTTEYDFENDKNGFRRHHVTRDATTKQVDDARARHTRGTNIDARGRGRRDTRGATRAPTVARTSRSSPPFATLPGGAIPASPGSARRDDGDDAVRTRREGFSMRAGGRIDRPRT